MEPAVYTPSKPIPAKPVSFEEFIEWLDEDTHAEWVDGKVVPRPVVSVKHQDCSGFVFRPLAWAVEVIALRGFVYFAPLVVKYTLPDGRQAARQPDLVVVLNNRLSQLREYYLDGAPNLIVEVVSPNYRSLDRAEKFAEYEAAGVPEYWVVDPDREYAEFWQLDEAGAYRAALAGSEGVYRSRELPDFWLRVEWLWKQPPLREVIRAWGLQGTL